MLIKVGIHDNLVVTNDTKVNEHGTLELGIATAQDTSDLLAAFQNNATGDQMKSSFRFYPPNQEDFDKNQRSSGDIAGDLLKMKDQLMKIAALFAPEETVEAYIGGTKMLEGIGIAPEQYAKALEGLTNKDLVAAIVTNLATKFVAFLTAADAFSGSIKFRMKFLRQSKLKNFAVISKSDFDTWIEPMTIPKAQSKISWSEYEVTKGLNDPTPAKADAPEQPGEAVEALKGAELFGPGTKVETPEVAAPAVVTEEMKTPVVGEGTVEEAVQPDLIGGNTEPVKPVVDTPPAFVDGSFFTT
jgi:hypothetical protein